MHKIHLKMSNNECRLLSYYGPKKGTNPSKAYLFAVERRFRIRDEVDHSDVVILAVAEAVELNVTRERSVFRVDLQLG